MRQGWLWFSEDRRSTDFTAFIRHPKWVIGFSDITLLHSHIHRHCSGKPCIVKCAIVFRRTGLSWPMPYNRIASKDQAMPHRRKMDYWIEAHPMNRQGKGHEGVLIGETSKHWNRFPAARATCKGSPDPLFRTPANVYTAWRPYVP